ncbi:carbohydrate kinase family protein [Pseudorhodobacter sp.]|uniref:carbohydrate kinase family protein n=1 Tax=Pseudorhodobacter sp. TaxID=1934400 RepID=UPI002649F1AB|nr:carbohydrate kinase family protein [Pseudorhodobacter sp.]MDN5789009.1 carbohydrate kinase family protein [Pseudorhodobacter sp.]
MNRFVVTGYASLDHVLHLGGDVVKDRTTQIRHRDPAAWPRAGGCPTYVARAVAKAGQSAAPVTWIGDDAGGQALLDQYAAFGLDAGGVARLTGERSPISVLAYQPDGAVSCLYDPGFAGRESLTKAQRALIAGASHICVTIGPGHLVADILDLVPVRARLYWGVKDDPVAFDAYARARLSARADVIFCNHAERALVQGSDALLVVTHGRKGAEAIGPEGSIWSPPVDLIATDDAVGAGDSFAGGFIAAEMRGETEVLAAVKAGVAAAAALLTERART